MNLVVSCMMKCCELHCRQVLEVIAACHNVTVEEAAKIIYHNTLELYFPWELEYYCLFQCSKSL